ncbi:MAG: zinc-binding dehydrogenase [Arthrobacter sp.]|uniref:zinc-binding dehydrogenase n=1 Tax=Arthrobacter sp. TaxID=1667 RepID=UPI003491D5F4
MTGRHEPDRGEGVRPGERLPQRVDVVIETVGGATWAHSLSWLRPGGAIVIAGTSSGTAPAADLGRIFYQQLRILGSTGSTRHETVAMLRVLEATGLRPRIDRVLPLARIHEGLRVMIDGDAAGKIAVAIP